MDDTDRLLRNLIEKRGGDSPPPALSFGSSASSATSENPSPIYAGTTSSSEATTPSAFSLPGSYIGSSMPKRMASSSPPPILSDHGCIVPPNFGHVAEEVYRSSFPRQEHFPYLRTLGLRTVLTLVLEEYPEENRQFLEQEGIELIQLGMPNNKDPHAQIPADTIRKALAVVLDRRRHPLLIHCNRGKHRTGCLVGCLRQMQRWSHEEALDEYSRYAHPKERLSDQNFISSFLSEHAWTTLDIRWLPNWIDYEECCSTRAVTTKTNGLTTVTKLSESTCGIKVGDGG